MAKRIIYSHKALADRKQILEYWQKRNGSKDYSRKLFRLFQSAAILISHHPEIGLRTEFVNVRGKVVRDYQIFYEEKENEILILAIWDSRQNPVTNPFNA